MYRLDDLFVVKWAIVIFIGNANGDMEKVVDWNEWKWASTLISFLLFVEKNPLV
jgi:hypothetical protein